jgi:hypothetical protein
MCGLRSWRGQKAALGPNFLRRANMFRPRASLEAEILILHHQLNIHYLLGCIVWRQVFWGLWRF